MYIRYTQPPADLYGWYEEFLQDEEEIDVKAGGGQLITIGQMLVQFLTKLDWCGTLFPRIPVPIQKQIQSKLEDYAREYGTTVTEMAGVEAGGNNKHGQKHHRGNDYGQAAQYEDKGRGSGNYDNRNHRFDGQNGGPRGGGSRRVEDEVKSRYYADERQQSTSSSSAYRSSKYSRSRSRSPAPPPARERASKNYYEDSGRGSGSKHRRRSASLEDRYEARRGGEYRERGDYYDRESSHSSAHRRRH